MNASAHFLVYSLDVRSSSSLRPELMSPAGDWEAMRAAIANGADAVHFGVRRVVLARELSARDISTIAAATDTALEVFIHGALCVAYSGQCLTSESLGGRSANRGQCAQACRLPYELIVDGKPKDLGDK